MQVLQCGVRSLTYRTVEQSSWISALCLFWAPQLPHSRPARVFRFGASQLCPTIFGPHRNVRFAFQGFLWRTLQRSLLPFRRKAHRVESPFWCRARCKLPMVGLMTLNDLEIALRQNMWLGEILERFEEIALPDSWLVAGCIAQTIWNLRCEQ